MKAENKLTLYTNVKILAWSKLKAFTDNKILLDVVKMMISLFDRFQNTVGKGVLKINFILTTLKNNPFGNIVGKGENAANQHFLLIPNCFLTCLRNIS